MVGSAFDIMNLNVTADLLPEEAWWPKKLKELRAWSPVITSPLPATERPLQNHTSLPTS